MTNETIPGDDASNVNQYQRRRLVLWRGVALAALVVAGAALFLPARPHPPANTIARFEIKGVISDRVRPQVEAIERAERDPHIRGLLLVIDSPGGGVTGGVALHDAVASFAAHKPVAVSMQGTAASAGYMIAVSAQRIFAYPSTITGSIGVIMIRPDASGLLGRIGLTTDTIVSGAMKDQSQPFVPLKPEGRVMLQGIVDDLFDQFVTMVSKGRHRSVEDIRALADGRPYTGRQAVPLHLIDQLGDEGQALVWLRGQIHDGKDLPLRTIEAKKPAHSFFGRLQRELGGDWFGIGQAVEALTAYQKLDGAVAILPR
ncbi:signal peptide peptidase SppA [Asaia spathodeae]|uniref:Signal peptide peptidase SppA n=1 Tax=Asaia spathodeae TaxID=657016 RepID=A0ABX2P4I3_9PROT|nr:signal peptide peptidase SppA [Asaia spathodeae]GBR11562.1 signal peptide peptidase sppA [Asaia spathodeae NBRC 105894]